MSALLAVRHLHVAYGNVEAVHDVSLSVAPGTIVSVIGPNGAGKTTLLAAIVGLLPARGEIDYLGGSAAMLSVEQRVARGLILVPERRELFAAMSVADNLELGAFQRVRSGDDPKETLGEVYQRFPRLAERREQLAGTLSGGERQMLAMGRAMMGRPKVLLLDEPSLGLAPLIVKQIFGAIQELNRKQGLSVFLVEQNARAALQVSDYGYVLETGELALEGPSTELAVNPRVAATYLGKAAQA